MLRHALCVLVALSVSLKAWGGQDEPAAKDEVSAMASDQRSAQVSVRCSGCDREVRLCVGRLRVWRFPDGAVMVPAAKREGDHRHARFHQRHRQRIRLFASR